MGPPSNRKIAQAVEEAFAKSDEPLRSAPAGFCRKVMARLDLFRLIQSERRRFRWVYGSLGAAVTAISLLGLGAALRPAWFAACVGRVPGGLGYCDLLLVSTWVELPRLVGGGLAFLALPLGLLLLTAILPHRSPAGRPPFPPARG